MLRRCLFVVLALTLLAPGWSASANQANPWHNQFVTSPDGRLWVVVGSMRYPVQAKPIAVAELAQLTEGAPVATRDEVCALIDNSAPVASAPADPVKALVGKGLKVCRNGTALAVQVVEATAAKVLNGHEATGQWVSLTLSVVNNGRDGESLYQSLGLRDERGRTWQDIAGTAATVLVNFDQLANQAGAQSPNTIIRPGPPTRVLVVFDVAADVATLELFSIDTRC